MASPSPRNVSGPRSAYPGPLKAHAPSRKGTSHAQTTAGPPSSLPSLRRSGRASRRGDGAAGGGAAGFGGDHGHGARPAPRRGGTSWGACAPPAQGGVMDGTDWQDAGLCAQTDPEMFFPEKGGSTKDAK